MELECDRCAIRTREAYALDLKTNPFDRSGNLPHLIFQCSLKIRLLCYLVLKFA